MPLSDGATYYLFQQRHGLWSADNVVLVLADTGEAVYADSLSGVRYTEDEIGVMADRIVYTEELIVEAEALIVDVIAYTQDNTLRFVDMLLAVTWPLFVPLPRLCNWERGDEAESRNYCAVLGFIYSLL